MVALNYCNLKKIFLSAQYVLNRWKNYEEMYTIILALQDPYICCWGSDKADVSEDVQRLI